MRQAGRLYEDRCRVANLRLAASRYRYHHELVSTANWSQISRHTKLLEMPQPIENMEPKNNIAAQNSTLQKAKLPANPPFHLPFSLFHVSYFFFRRALNFLPFFAGAGGFTALIGSPFAAFATSPPDARAISASSLPLETDLGSSTVMSFGLAYSSRCLMSSQDSFVELPNPRVRTSTQEP